MLCRLMHNTSLSGNMRLLAEPMIPFELMRGEREEERTGIWGMVARLERRKDKQVAEMTTMMLHCWSAIMWAKEPLLPFSPLYCISVYGFCLHLSADYNQTCENIPSGWNKRRPAEKRPYMCFFWLGMSVDLKNRDIQYAAKIPDTIMVYVSPHYKHLI